MALLLLCAGFAGSSLSYGQDLDPCEKYFSSPLLESDLPRVVQPHFGSFSHSRVLEPYALDLAARTGAKVHAMKEGIVFKVVDNFGEGGVEPKFLYEANYVVIKHEGGIYTLYSHLKGSSVTVKPGQMLKRGEVIGEVGCSGYCEARHLHVEGFIQAGELRRSFPIAIINPAGLPQRYFEKDEEIFSRCPVI